MKGNLTDIPVTDLIQLNCQNRKQGLLTIVHDDIQGQLYFMEGNVVHAILENLEGEEVVYKIINWETGTFDFEADIKPDKTTITKKWQGLLLEGAKFLDESSNEKASNNYTQINPEKESNMNIKKLNQVVENLKEDIGAALVATDIWSIKDAQALAGFNSQPKAIALFNEITRSIDKSLKGSGFPGLGTYYMVNLENDMVVVVVQIDEYQEGMLVDLSKTTLGLLMSIALPRVVEGLSDAIK